MTDPTPPPDPSPFNTITPAASLHLGDGLLTLVEGQIFQLSDGAGDMDPNQAHGLIVADTRVLSRWELRLNGSRIEALASEPRQPFHAVIVGRGRARAGHADSDLVVRRDRQLGQGMREAVTVTNYGLERQSVQVELHCDADFADLFEVKERRVERQLGRYVHELRTDALVFGHHGERGDKQVTITVSPGAELHPERVRWTAQLDPGDQLEIWCEVTVSLGGTEIEPTFREGAADPLTIPHRRLADWHELTADMTTDNPALAAVLTRSAEDLGALHIFDPDHPDRPIIAAGAPWFMTVFGRDSLITAWMTLVADPSLAHGVLKTLAQFQGMDVNPLTEEEPGKIVHEMRFGGAGGLALGGGDRYYGSIDATPLFVMLIGELFRWDANDELIIRMAPHADRAIDWIEQFGDRDGDGFVEYQRLHEHGLANQGWKDSWDAVRHADGTLAPTPIALCEVQGYAYAAYLARAEIATALGDHHIATRCHRRASTLRRQFNEEFWSDRLGTFVLGLDRDKRQIEVATSNVGHCLWTGIVDPERAEAAAARLVDEQQFSGFGIRTLSRDARAYNPISYHNGSVWPHDNAIAAAGLARSHQWELAHQVITAQLEVAAMMGHRLPELFAGLDRGELAVPAPYPSSCSPQAWAAAAPLLWLRTLLGLEPRAAQGQLWLDVHMPEMIRHLQVDGLQLAGQQVRITVDDGIVDVEGMGPLVLHHGTPSEEIEIPASAHDLG